MEEIQEVKENKEKVEQFEIKILVKDIETKDGKKFKKYSMVADNGKLVDLRFRMDTDAGLLAELNKCKKAKVTLGYLSDASAYYEYPRVYASDIISVEKLV